LAAKKLSPIAEAHLAYITQEKGRIIRESFDWFENY
jgi:hypothetical protein